MQITRKIAPGQKGAKRLFDEYADSLFCARYRYDRTKRKRFKTVEITISSDKGGIR